MWILFISLFVILRMGWCYRRLGILAPVVLRGRTLGRSGLFTFVGVGGYLYDYNWCYGYGL